MKYIGYCPAHNWESMRRDTPREAEADLQGHVELFPDESHFGSSIRTEDSEEFISSETVESQRVCYALCPDGWYVSQIYQWSDCPGGWLMEIVRTGADIIRCSATHIVPSNYAIIQIVPRWYYYDGFNYDQLVCQKLGAQQMQICSCQIIPQGYAIERTVSWSVCRGTDRCLDGTAYVIRKIS